jgi:hypothetical protein
MGKGDRWGEGEGDGRGGKNREPEGRRGIPYEPSLPNLRGLVLAFHSKDDTPASFAGFFSVLKVYS